MLQFTIIIITLLIFLAFLFFYISQKKPIANSSFITIVLLAGLFLRIVYFAGTPMSVREYDLTGHLDYIKYISVNHSLPSAKDCWECYHPPLYYLAVSPVCSFTSCNSAGYYLMLQLISLFFNLGFLIFGLKLLRLFLPEKFSNRYFNLAGALLIFWPSGIIMSSVINNDSLLYFLMAAGLYFTTKWFMQGERINILASVLFMILSLLTKSNGLILLGIICFAVLLRFFLLSRKKMIFSSVLIFVLLGIIFGFIFLKPINFEKNKFVGNIGSLNPALRVGNKINNYIIFDSKDFLENPFVDTWRDKGGRQYFFNFLLKTSLFEEFVFEKDFLKKQAIFISCLLLFVVAIFLSGMIFLFFDMFKIFKKIPKKIPAQVIIIPMILLFLGAMIGFRYLYPYSCANDFRYIYPIIIPVSAGIAFLPHALSRWNRFAALTAETVSYIFVVNCIIFFFAVAL